MALAGIELCYLVGRINEAAAGCYVANIYGIDRGTVLFKLRHPERDALHMMVSPAGIWLTGVRVEQAEPNRLLRRLRSDLVRLRVAGVRQDGAERIAYVDFEGFGRSFTLAAEFFGGGNMILCSGGKILALQRSIDVRHRKLSVGLEYAPPPAGADVLSVSEDDFAPLGSTDLAAGKWLGRTLGLPKKYVEGILGIAGIDPGAAGESLSRGDISGLCAAARRVVGDVVSGAHDPVISGGDALPLRLGAGPFEPVPSFMEGLDRLLTGGIVDRATEARGEGPAKQIAALESRLEEQQKAAVAAAERAASIKRAAGSLYELAARGLDIRDPESAGILAAAGASLGTERGAHVVEAGGERIRIDPDAPPQSVASAIFDAAKRHSGAAPAIEAAIRSTQKRLEEARTGGAPAAPAVAGIRRRAWYERYRWFHTSGGLLAVGGRDAPSNSAVVRKQMAPGDTVFHGDIFGSPFFVLKGGAAAPAQDIEEVARATVCFSRAWRGQLHGVRAFWVDPSQVRRSAPSGEYLPKGSFTITGSRNFAAAGALKLAVGVFQGDGGPVVSCGPPGAVSATALCHAVIEPGGSEVSDVAKRIRNDLAGMDPAASVPGIDEYVRALPPGKSRVTGTGH